MSPFDPINISEGFHHDVEPMGYIILVNFPWINSWSRQGGTPLIFTTTDWIDPLAAMSHFYIISIAIKVGPSPTK
jgi:hypothetical protein